MDSMFPTDGNRYAGGVKSAVAAGADTGPVYIDARTPYRLDCVCMSFGEAASGDVEIEVFKKGAGIAVFKQTLEGSESVVVSDIGVWLGSNSVNRGAMESGDPPATDYVVVKNGTGASMDAVIDFAY